MIVIWRGVSGVHKGVTIEIVVDDAFLALSRDVDETSLRIVCTKSYMVHLCFARCLSPYLHAVDVSTTIAHHIDIDISIIHRE